MMNKTMLRGSGAGLAAIIKVDTTIGFLTQRKEGIDLSPSPAKEPAYVWKRVFLKGKGHRN